MILSHYKKICDKIRLNLTESRRVSIALNAWSSSQRVAYLKVLIYWINVEFQCREHLIEFTSFNIEHIERQLIMKLMKILKNYVIKNKLFEIVINNASNNSILKEKLEKIMSHHEFWWDRTQNFINYLTHIINLMTQDFIQALESKTIADNLIAQLKNDFFYFFIKCKQSMTMTLSRRCVCATLHVIWLKSLLYIFSLINHIDSLCIQALSLKLSRF